MDNQIAESTFQLLIEVTKIVLIPILIWTIATLRRTERAVDRIMVVLFGANGENGMNSDIKLLKSGQSQNNLAIHDLVIRIKSLEGSHNAH